VPRWIAYFTRAGEYRRYVEAVALGININNFRTSDLEALPLPIAPQTEQLRIVSKLDHLFNRSNNSREELAHIPHLVERYRAALLAEAFRGKATADWRERYPDRGGKALPNKVEFEPPYETPSSWIWTSLGQLGVLDRGRSRHRPRNAPELYGGPYPFVQTGDIKAARGRLFQFGQTYSEAGLAQSRLWPRETLCITIAANIAETAILGIEACFPDSIVGFTATTDLCDPRFIEFFIMTAKADLAAFAPATAQKNINLETLRTLRVPCPPLEEQKQIVKWLEKGFRCIQRVTNEISRGVALLARLDQATLSKAFRGELVPQDPNDEPARHSLARGSV